MDDGGHTRLGHGADEADGRRELQLRPLTVQDAEVMAEVLADPSLYHHTGGEPPTVQALRRRYTVQSRGASADGREIWLNLLVTLPEGPIGYVQATIDVESYVAEIAWVIGAPWQRRGYAQRGAALLIAELSGRGVVEVIAHIHPDHTASQHVAASLGMLATDQVIDSEVRWRRDLRRRLTPAAGPRSHPRAAASARSPH